MGAGEKAEGWQLRPQPVPASACGRDFSYAGAVRGGGGGAWGGGSNYFRTLRLPLHAFQSPAISPLVKPPAAPLVMSQPRTVWQKQFLPTLSLVTPARCLLLYLSPGDPHPSPGPLLSLTSLPPSLSPGFRHLGKRTPASSFQDRHEGHQPTLPGPT